MVKITGPKAVTLPAVLGGNDQIYGLVLVAVTRGIIVKDAADGLVVMDGITDLQLVSVDIVKLLLSQGCEVENYPVYFEVADLAAEVPANFPNRTYSAPNEDPEVEPTQAVHTWATWYDGMPGHDPVEIGGKFYCSSANTWNMGRPLPASAWGALNVVSISEFQQLQPQPEL